MIISDNQGYYFDRMEIYTTQQPDDLKINLPMKALAGECKHLKIRHSPDTVYSVSREKTGTSKKMLHEKIFYRSIIELGVPTKKFWQLLLKHEHVLNHWMITYMELARDDFSRSVIKAEDDSVTLFGTIRKKYSYGHMASYRRVKTKKEVLEDRRRGLFSDYTWYSTPLEKGSKDHVYLKLVIYARHTKINFNPDERHTWMPCIHHEWRIKGWSHIQKKTRILKITDLINFDFIKFFQTMEEKYIVHEELDLDKLAYYLAGYNGPPCLSKLPLRIKHIIATPLNHFRQYYEFYSYSDFVNAVKKEKEWIKHKRGFRNVFQTRIMNMRNLKRFAIPLNSV